MKSICTLATIALALAFPSCSPIKSAPPAQPEKTTASTEITFKRLSAGDGATPWNFTTREKDVIKRFKSRLDQLCEKGKKWEPPKSNYNPTPNEINGVAPLILYQDFMLICDFCFDDADSCDKEPKTLLYYPVNRHISGDIILGQPNGHDILISENELRSLIKQLQKTMILPGDKHEKK